MNTRKNQILSLLIVGALAAIGTGATEAYAVVIPVDIRARLRHPSLFPAINLVGGGHIRVVGSHIAPGTFNLTDTAGPGRARISWSTGSVDSTGRFRVEGRAVAQWVDRSGVVRYVRFRMVIRGRTNGTSRIRGRFRDVLGTAGAHLGGRCSG
jgi:hypothetical protein